MSQLEADSEGINAAEEMALRADAYRIACGLLALRDDWAEGVTPHDALQLARFLAE